MNFKTIEFEYLENSAVITLNRPDKANAMNPQMLKELYQAALLCDQDPQIRAVLIQAKGRYFCCGGDMSSFREVGDKLPEFLREMSFYLHGATSYFSRMAKPVVAAVNGVSAGGGFGFSQCADIVIAGSSAKFTLAYTKSGLTPDGGATYFLPRILGTRKAKEMIMLNSVLDAEKALDWGLVNKVVDDKALADVARKTLLELAAGPTAAFGKVKYLIESSLETSLERQLDRESASIASMARTQDCRAGIDAFLDKTHCEFIGK